MGCPTCFVFDHNNQIMCCDMAHQAVLKLKLSESAEANEFVPVVKDFLGAPFNGPNSMIYLKAGGPVIVQN